MTQKPHYAHGMWFPVADVEPLPLHPIQVFFTDGAKTNYELWQMEKYGNYIKAQGSEYAERYIDKTKNHE